VAVRDWIPAGPRYGLIEDARRRLEFVVVPKATILEAGRPEVRRLVRVRVVPSRDTLGRVLECAVGLVLSWYPHRFSSASESERVR